MIRLPVALAAIVASSVGAASGQSLDMLPHPMDVISGQPRNKTMGACETNYYSAAGAEIQKIYRRHGRCGEYSKNLYRKYSLWVRAKHDPDDDRDYGDGAIGD